MRLLPLRFPPPPYPIPGQSPSSGREVTITEYDLERVAVLFGTAKSLGTVFNPQQDALLTRVFDDHLRGTLADLRARLGRESDDSLRQSHVLVVSVAAQRVWRDGGVVSASPPIRLPPFLCLHPDHPFGCASLARRVQAKFTLYDICYQQLLEYGASLNNEFGYVPRQCVPAWGVGQRQPRRRR